MSDDSGEFLSLSAIGKAGERHWKQLCIVIKTLTHEYFWWNSKATMADTTLAKCTKLLKTPSSVPMFTEKNLVEPTGLGQNNFYIYR